MHLNRETMGFEPEAETRKRYEPTLPGAKQYLIDHLGEFGFENDKFAVKHEPIDALPSFEAHCNALREKNSPDLYLVRQFIHLIDLQEKSGGRVPGETDPDYIDYKRILSALLSDIVTKKYSEAPKGDSMEQTEANVERDQGFAAINTYDRLGNLPGTIEPLMALLEEKIATLDYEIDKKSASKDKLPRDARPRLREVSAAEETRKKYRRARIFLMNQYFPK